MPRRTATAVVLSLLLGFTFAGTTAGAAQGAKTPRPDAPTLQTRFRDKLRSVKKDRAAKKAGVPRLSAVPTPDRGAVFAERRTAEAAKAAPTPKGAPAVTLGEHPVRVEPKTATAKTSGGLPFEGRHGTGLGDIFESEPNDTTAQILDDLPVNVVGHMDEENDLDTFAITAFGGESIRIEVVADRIFGSRLDSYLEVLDDQGTVLDSNDDFFDNSADSFLRFIPPTSGENLYFVRVSDFAFSGGPDFGYILNIAVADSPDVSEAEPNDTTTNADVFPIPSVAFGASDVTDDLDVYTFEADANQTLVIDVDAEVFASDMDPVVELYDNVGGFLFGVDDTDGADPRFNIVLPYSGTYYVAVYDRDGLGGGTYYYSMNLSLQNAADSPRITSFKVLVGGSTGQLLKQVRGAGFTNAGGGTVAEIDGAEVRSFPAPAKPTTRVKVQPGQPVDVGQSVTVVNPDGRRSNPGLISRQ